MGGVGGARRRSGGAAQARRGGARDRACAARREGAEAEHAAALGGVQGAHVDRVEPADARALAVGPRLGGEHGAPPRRRRRPPAPREDDAERGDRRRRQERLRQHAAQAGDGRPVPPRAEGRDRGGEGGAALPVRVHRALRRRGRLGRRVGGRPRLSAVGAAGALLEGGGGEDRRLRGGAAGGDPLRRHRVARGGDQRGRGRGASAPLLDEATYALQRLRAQIALQAAVAEVGAQRPNARRSRCSARSRRRARAASRRRSSNAERLCRTVEAEATLLDTTASSAAFAMDDEAERRSSRRRATGRSPSRSTAGSSGWARTSPRPSPSRRWGRSSRRRR